MLRNTFRDATNEALANKIGSPGAFLPNNKWYLCRYSFLNALCRKRWPDKCKLAFLVTV